MKDCEPRLSDEERKRNQHGPMQVYVYTEQDLGKIISLTKNRIFMFINFCDYF